MRFIETELYGACIVDLASHEDERDFFTRLFDAKLLEEYGKDLHRAQGNFPCNRRTRILRGMYWEEAEAPESKFIRWGKSVV